MSVSNEKSTTTHRLLLIEPAHSPKGLSCSWEIFNQITFQKTNIAITTLLDSGCTYSPSLLNLGAELESMLCQKEENEALPLIIKIRHPKSHAYKKLLPIPPEQMRIFSGAILYKLHPKKMFLPK